MTEPRIYLDHNATTQPLPEVVEVVSQHLRESYANPGSRHAPGRQARNVLEAARESMAEILQAEPGELVFTSGGTEATNLALFGLMQDQPGTILLTRGEHPATLETCKIFEQKGWKLHYLQVDSGGRLLSDQYADLPWDQIRLVTVILAHNETGVIQELSLLGDYCEEHRVPFHVDAVQAVGKIQVSFHALKASTLALGAHKFYGPRGIGALLVRDHVRLGPVLFGGHQEAGRRPGTEPVPLIAGMAKALEVWNADREAITARLQTLRDGLQQGLESTCSPVVINGSRAHRLPNTLNISFPGLQGEAMLVALDLEGIACSLGSTCASGSAEPAPVLVSMGCPAEVYQSAVRFSLGWGNTTEEMDSAVNRISRIVQRLRNMA